ncbi:uncharacterized protein [Rutidosis leptorrhynchoides]|uniref:uncharacterized protein n=1 Tax=Rutidosis leptorrhynchoides TaxID=125765 RepID=UPI003A9A1950
MGSYQNLILSKSNTSVVGQHEFETVAPNNSHKRLDMMEKKEGFIGVLDVFVHQARNIQNICIYHKQDVYAKIYLTSNPEATKSTRVINGAGQNPVFDENLRVNVQKGDCSLKCEIWMLSRIRNYLQDQLLGFTTVPLCEILVESSGKLEKEFKLSTSEVFESPCGFVKLSIVYTGTQPDVFEIPSPNGSRNQNLSDERDEVCSELEKIEFSDPNIMKENEIMVSEYYSSTETESPSLVNSQITENDDFVSSNFSDLIISRASKENVGEVTCVTNDESSESDKPEASEKIEEKSQSSVDSNKTEAEEKVVQQDFVDMYLKSMKQFTEALEKMNFPMKTGKESPDSGVNDCAESNPNGKKSTVEGPCPKVFYGSRAFF